jgi:hypothetical protein
MHPPVHVGVAVPIVEVHCLQNRQRLLGSGRIVEVDERLAVDLALQDWKIRPHLGS